MLKTSSTDASKEDALAFIKSQAKGTADTGKADALAFIKEQQAAQQARQEKVQSKIQTSAPQTMTRPDLLRTTVKQDTVAPRNTIHASGQLALPVTKTKEQEDLEAIQRRVDHLHDVMGGDDPREARRAEQELRAMQPIYRNMYGAYERANGITQRSVTEDQVRAASDALTQAKSNALSASLRLGSALTVRGQNPYSDTDENIQRMVSEAQEYSASAHAAEQKAAAAYNKLAGDYQYQKYAGLRMRPDFLINSYGDAETANRGAESTDAAEIAYARIYGRDHATAKPDNLSGDIYRYVTDDEAHMFYYLWNTQGKKAASEYLKSVEYQINERLAAEQQERINKLTETTAGKVYASAASVLLNQGSIIGVVDLTMQNIRRMLGDNRPIDYNTQAQAIGKAAQQIRANVSENLEGNTKTQLFGITNLAAFLYQTGMSMADSSLQLVLNRFGVPEPVTLALMSGGAAQQAVYDAKEHGASDGQALLTGYAAGIAEYAFEKISLDKLVNSIEAKAGETIGEKLTEKWTSNLAKKVGAGIINAGQQGLVEGSEEAFTTLANTVTDLMINGDKSELLKDIDEMGTGPALRKWITGLALDAMGGIISGVGMGMGGNVLRYAGGVAEDAASAARAAAEKESGQAQAETPAEPETRTAPPTPSESNPLAKALDKLRSGEQLTKNDARRIMEDEASMQTLRDAGLARDIRPGGDGREQIRQAVASYARLNTNLLTQAQAQGNLETNTEEVVSNGRTVETPDRTAAETAGEREPQTSFRERARAAAETQRSREILDREERRSGLGRFLAEYRANRAQRSAESQFDEQNRRANSLRNQAEARNLTFTSAAEQGVPGGSEDQTFQVMPTDMLDRNMRKAQQEAAKNGIDLRFMIGQGRVNDSSGDYNFRGWISADRKRMLIQADHSKLTWQQILDHEELHKLIKSAPGYRQAVEDALLSDARLHPYLSSIVDRYAEAYNSLGVTDENEIIEELLADYRAGFDMLDIARGRAGDVRTKATAKKDIRAVEKRVQNNQPVSVEETAKASREYDSDYMAAAQKLNEASKHVPTSLMNDVAKVRETIKAKLADIEEVANLPEDREGNTYFPNSSYSGSEENTTVCPRSVSVDALADAVGDALGRPLTVEESVYVAQQAFHFTDVPQCLYCYVAMDRMAKRQLLGEYINKRTQVLTDLQNGMSVAEALAAFKKRETAGGKSWSQNKQDRFNMWVRNYESGVPSVRMSNLSSEAAVEKALADPNLKAEMEDALKYAQNASWAKKRVGYTAYNNHILKWDQSRIDALNTMFGLRLYSFSDYSPAYILENMQMVTDAAVRGLKMLAYTKELDFVRIFAGTGMNINVSTFGMDGGDGTVHEDAMQGASWKEAQELRKQFPNVGITFVATNDNQVNWALDQDWIDVVIPFHMVKTGATVAGILGYQNYTGESSDKKIQGVKARQKEIFPSQHQNDKQKYLDALQKARLTPRFERWLDHPNYMKLVNETRRSAQDTPAVQPKFDQEAVNAALKSLDDMVKRGGYGVPIGGTLENLADIALEMADELKKGVVQDLKERNKGKASREMEPEYNRTALLTEETVDRWLKDYASKSSPKYAQAYVTRMTPNQFLRLTTSRTGRLAIEEQTRELDAEKLIEATQQNPLQLIISDGEVVGHEGRHRANALLRAGVDSIPVLVFDHSNKYSKQHVPLMTLQGQDFGSTKSYATETLQNLTPLSYENRDKIVQDYGTQPAYERMQAKYSGRKTMKFSREVTPQQDKDYLAAVERGDMDTAQRMVDETAKAAGYTVKAWHGTRAFGFTKFDPGKSDDGISLFATSNPLTAETYSGKTERRRVKERSFANVYELHGKELISEAAKYNKRYQDYKLMSAKDKSKIREDERNAISWSIRRAQEFVGDHDGAFDKDKAYIMDRLISALYHLRDAETENDIEDAWSEWEDAVWDIKGIDDSIALEFLDDVDSRGLFTSKNRLRDMTYPRDMYIDDSYGSPDYIFDARLQLELDAELHKGIYELYGYPGKQLVIDTNGENWNSITPPKELRDYGLYGPQRTRDIASAAKALGYDSVLFKNLRDNGGETPYNGESDIYIFFNPKALKSADPVTYDDRGNVIHLSERFNTQDDDIRFSREIDPDTLRDLNEAEKNGDVIHLYRTMEVVEDEDGRKALRSPMADTVRRDPNAGKTPRTAGNIIFRSAPFGYVDENGDVYDIVDGEQTGASWIKADEHPETATMKPGAKWASTNIGKPVSGDNTGVAYNPYNHASNYVLNDQFKGAYERPNLVTVEVIVPRSEEDHPYHADMAKDPVGWADWKSGDVATALAKAGGEPRRLFLSRWMKVVRVLSDAEVADRIVNHDLKGTGIKIPANTVTPSLREALREIDPDIISEPQNPKSYYAYQSKIPSGNTSREIDPQEAELHSPETVEQRQVAGLMRENEELKKALQKWKAQVKASDRTQPREADVRRMAKDLLNTYTSEADGDHVTEALRELAHTIMSNGTRWTDVRDQAVRLASDILDKSSELVDAGEAEFYREIRRTIKGYKIAFTQKNDIPDYNEWRKANFGRLTISKDGIPVDVLWEELQDTYGRGFFPDDIINPTDQILYLADLWDRLQDPYVNPYRANMAEAVQFLASDIIDRVIGDEIRQAPTTYADRAQERVARATLKGELRAQKIKERLEEERQRRKKDLADLKEHYKTKEAKGRESRKAREMRAKITKHANDMTDRLLHPTDKKHVPEALRQPVAAVLSAIDLGSAYSYTFDSDGNFKRVPRGLELGTEETRRTQAFQQVREALLKEAGDLVLDPELMGTIEEPGSLTRLVTDLANVPIASMNAEQLQVVYDALRGIEGAVRSANRMLSQARWAAVSDAADAFKAENAAKTAPLELNGPLGRVEDLTRLDMLTPEAYFHRFGKSGQAIFGMLRSAQDAFIVNMANATEATKKIVGNTDVSALERETHTVTMDGQDVTMTTAQIMELYCLMQRDQGLQHITTGGIMIEPARQGLKKTTQAEPLHPSMEELLNAVKLLTPEELRLADELQKYLSVDMAELGNEATMQVYGYNKFGQEEKYWKIRSNKNEITQSIEKETQTTSVANRGFTKPVNPQANTSVKIGSIFDTYSQSVNDMATYAAWLAVGEDVNRIRNYTFRDDEGKRIGTVKGILDRVIGSGGANYLQRLMADIANGAGMDDAGLTAGFVGAYKAAAIGANVRVIIQQPTAIIRAAEMIDPKYLASGLKNPMKAFERAKKYSPIAQWKDWGYFDINTGRKMKDVLFENSSKLEKVRQASMAMAGKADSFAWGQLWGAVEAETKDKTDLKPGTSDFYEACAERFNAIIDHTQVVDGILQRSQIMRSKNAITRMAVSFMSEPTKQYNQFMSAVYDYKHSGDKKQAKQMMARTVFSMLAAGVANVLAQSLIDALRDDDREKKYWEKLLEKFFGYNPDDKTFGEKLKTFAFSNMGELINPASYLPYAKDIMSIIQGYSVDRMDMDAISDTITAMTRLYKALNGEGKQTAAYSIVKLTEQAAKLLGLPAYNLDRDVTSLFTTIINDADIPVLQYYLNRYRYKPPESGNLPANLKGILWDAKQKGDGSYSIIAGHLLKDGYTQETIGKAMTAMLSDESGYTAAQKAADAAGDNNGSYNLAEKLEAFSSLTLSEEDRDTLLEAKLSDTQYAQYVVLQGYSDYDTWLSVMMDMPDSSPTQDEIEAVLDTRDELTTTQKAAYWQVLSKATTAKNNPYSQEVGQEILDAKASGGGSGGDKDRAPASTSGLRLPVVESTRRVDSGLRLPTVEHVEARPSSGLKLPTK